MRRSNDVSTRRTTYDRVWPAEIYKDGPGTSFVLQKVQTWQAVRRCNGRSKCAHSEANTSTTYIIAKPEYGPGVVQKLHADLYSPFAKTLFVDSDCLFYKHPDELWDLYAHGAFSIRGWRYLTGGTDYEKRTPYEWVQDTSQFLKLNDISRLPHFNGGVFYFDQSDTAARLFGISRSLYERRTELGFVPFKGSTP